jgi:hypothetical protein
MESGNFAEMTLFFSTPFRDILHAANLRHGANGFTFLPKEGMLRIFSHLMITKQKITSTLQSVASSLHTFVDTPNCVLITLLPSITPNSNYVIMVSD